MNNDNKKKSCQQCLYQTINDLSHGENLQSIKERCHFIASNRLYVSEVHQITIFPLTYNICLLEYNI